MRQLEIGIIVPEGQPEVVRFIIEFPEVLIAFIDLGGTEEWQQNGAGED